MERVHLFDRARDGAGEGRSDDPGDVVAGPALCGSLEESEDFGLGEGEVESVGLAPILRGLHGGEELARQGVHRSETHTSLVHAGAAFCEQSYHECPTFWRQLLTTQASEVTVRLLGVEVGEVAWPGALFGAGSNLHPHQVKFLEFDWIRMCAADGDSARWKPGVDDKDDSSKMWVDRPLSDPKAFGDGKLFTHVMSQVQGALETGGGLSHHDVRNT